MSAPAPLVVSRNEIWRLAQRALEGSGAPPGIDREGADAVVWLESRGLKGLALLDRDLGRLDRASFAPLEPRSDAAGACIACGGRPAVALAGSVVDYAEALARTAPGGRAVLGLRSCRTPAFLVPAAAVRRAADGSSVMLRWLVGQRWTELAILSPGTLISPSHGPDDFHDLMRRPGPVDIAIAIGNAAASPPRGEPVLPVPEPAPGVAVDPRIWDRIGRRAARVLVPATRQSRTRGAGGGDANS